MYFAPQSIRTISINDAQVAPIVEEMIYRVCCIHILKCTSLSNIMCICISALFFSSSHLHHYIELRKEGYKPFACFVVMTIQSVFSFLLGLLVGTIYIRTDTIFGIIVTHIYCNMIGGPNFSFFNSKSFNYRYRYFILSCYILGILLFFSLFNVFMSPQIFKSEFASI
ncbi:hypothetical protein WA158_006116 [Blastocystis sp. Blastoise]